VSIYRSSTDILTLNISSCVQGAAWAKESILSLLLVLFAYLVRALAALQLVGEFIFGLLYTKKNRF
jgi:hypothetical protein